MIDETLARVPWLAEAGDVARAEVAARARPVRFSPGQSLIVELEAGGDDIYVLTDGKASVSITDGRSAPRVVAELGPGDVCGELSMLTREVRSATVTATTPVSALRLSRAAFERIIERHPKVGAHFSRLLASRIMDTRDRLQALQYPTREQAKTVRITAPPVETLGRAWRELVNSNSLELPLLALLSFVLMLLALRGGAKAAGAVLLDYLRVTYTTGFVLVFAATAASLLRFRRRVQRFVAVGLGMGIGAIVNGLSVFLAFDMFYLDMTNRDPAMLFSVETLYRRNESDWAMLIVLVVLLQLMFLRRFYRRMWLVLRLRLSR